MMSFISHRFIICSLVTLSTLLSHVHLFAAAPIMEIQSTAQFNEVLDTHPAVVAKFHSTGCGQCKKYRPIFERAAHMTKTAHFCAVDVDIQKDLANRYGIRGVPATIYFKNGKEVDRITGVAAPETIRQKADMAFGR